VSRRFTRFCTIAAVAASALAFQAGSALAASSTSSNGGGQAVVSSISCTSAVNCAAVGYLTPPGQNLAFVISEKNGTWGKASKVPSLGALPGGSVRALVQAVSCSSAGNCAAGGLYVTHGGAGQAFVVTEQNGAWGNAKPVPGLPALNTGGTAIVELMACRSTGNCSAAGTYESDSSSDQQVFVLTEKAGVWGQAQEIRGTGALNTGGVAEVAALSCVTAGQCTVGGDYLANGGSQPFVAVQQNGAWGTAHTFPQVETLNTGKIGAISALSCRSGGTCTATGRYRTADSHEHPFVIAEVNGTWGAVTQVPGLAALPAGGAASATLGFLSCPAAGDCTAGGNYFDARNHSLAYLVTEKNGTWGKALAVPGAASLGKTTIDPLDGLACASPGNCTAAGSYADNLKASDGRVFVISEKNGKWGTAKALPGSVTLSGGRDVNPGALACGAAGDCVLGGSYVADRSLEAPFLATQKNGTWGTASEVPGVHP
jgi:hypothetical protein